MKTNIAYLVESKEKALIALKIFSSLMNVPVFEGSAEEFVRKHSDFLSPGTSCIHITTNGNDMVSSFLAIHIPFPKEFVIYKTLGEVTEALSKEISSASPILKLNSEYTAEVTKDVVKVGCQTFTHEKVLELAELVKKVRAK